MTPGKLYNNTTQSILPYREGG